MLKILRTDLETVRFSLCFEESELCTVSWKLDWAVCFHYSNYWLDWYLHTLPGISITSFSEKNPQENKKESKFCIYISSLLSWFFYFFPCQKIPTPALDRWGKWHYGRLKLFSLIWTLKSCALDSFHCKEVEIFITSMRYSDYLS